MEGEGRWRMMDRARMAALTCSVLVINNVAIKMSRAISAVRYLLACWGNDNAQI